MRHAIRVASPAATLRRMAVCIALLAAALPPARAQERGQSPDGDTAVFQAGATQGMLTRPASASGRLAGIVVVLHDSTGPDRRTVRYMDQLLGAHVAVIEIMYLDPSAGAIARLVEAVAADPRGEGARIGLLGFGSGARSALGSQGGVAAHALLYPGCDGLDDGAHAAPGTPLLLLHGADDAANTDEACARAATALEADGRAVRRIAYGDAGYAWDHPLYAIERRMLLPRPDGAGRIAVVPWPELTVLSATHVARFFLASLRPPQP